MRIPITVVIGVVLAIVGVIGLTVIFPNFMATNGEDFVNQIDTSWVSRNTKIMELETR